MAHINHGGIHAIRKPKGPTSHDIINELRRITGERRIGHAGTLDPLASGVLVVGIGREATKQLASIVAHEKEYVASIRLGATSSTDDAEGVIESHPVANAQIPITNDQIISKIPIPKRDDIDRVLEQFIGRIEQTPPAYSAVKIAGVPAYRRVRRGETVELKPRIVEIKKIEVLEYTPPLPTLGSGRVAPPLQEGEKHMGTLTLRVVCGPGVYIRSLARDIGAALGVGGYIATLERTRVGNFTLDRAQTIDQFREHWSRIAGEQYK